MSDAAESFEGGLVACRPSLFAFAVSLCGNAVRAEDLVQETMLRALVNKASFEAGTNLNAWLFTILKNLFRSQYRKLRREVEDPDMEFAGRVPFAEDQYHSVLYKQYMERIRQLPLDQLGAFRLVCWHGLSYEEAAEQLECSVGTIKSRVFRAKEYLARDGIEPPKVDAIPVESQDYIDEIRRLYRAGKSVGEIAQAIPTLTRADVMQAIMTNGLTGSRARPAAVA